MSIKAIASAGLRLPPIYTEMRVKTDQVLSDMRKGGKAATQEAEKISGRISQATVVANKMSSIGGSLTKFVTAPLIGAGIASGKMASDFNGSFAKVSTLLDDSMTDFAKYKKAILDGSSEAKVGVNDFSEAVYSALSAGVAQDKAIGFTIKSTALARGGFTTAAKSVDILTTALNGYKLGAENTTKVSDLLITTQNLGKTTVDELASSMGKVIPIAASANFGIEELSTGYAVLTKNGIATAEAGTYLKAMLSEVTKAGSESNKALRELSGKGFAELKKEGVPTTEILGMLSDYAEKNGKTLKDMFGSVEAGSAALVLANTNGQEYTKVLGQMESSAGATQKAVDKIDADPAKRLAAAINRAKNKAIELGEKLTPIFEKIVDTVSGVVDWFSKLDEGTQELIVKGGLLTAAAGPLLKAGSGLIKIGGALPAVLKGGAGAAKLAAQGLGLMAPAASGAAVAVESVAASAGAASGGVGLLSGGFTGLVASAAPVVAGVVAIAGGAYLVGEAFTQHSTPAADRFKEKLKEVDSGVATSAGHLGGYAETTTIKVSEETQKQLGAWFEMSDGAQRATMEMYAGVMPMTDANVKTITSTVGTMAQTTIAAIDSQKTESIQKYQELFAHSTTLTAEEKQQVLSDVEGMAKGRKEKVQAMRDRIIELYDEIKKKGVENAQAEKKELDELYKAMADEAVYSVARSKTEQELLLSNLKDSSTQVTTQMVEEIVQKMNAQRDESVKAAEDQYQSMMDAAVDYKTNLEVQNGALTIQQQRTYEKMVNDAKMWKEDTVLQIEHVRQDGLIKLNNTYPEITRTIDAETGKQLSLAQGWGKRLSEVFGGTSREMDAWNGKQLQDKEANITINRRENLIRTYQEQLVRTFASSLFAVPSHHYNGLDSVPYDGYVAHLHRGERVMTAKENREYSSVGGGNINVNIEKVENNTKEDVRELVQRIGQEMRRQRIGKGALA